MRPLTPDDLLSLEDFADRRREHFEAHVRYVDHYRRVRLGPRLALVFENRQTLWFCVQEVLRVARLADPARIREELAVYNRLLPGRGRLQAALLIDATANGDNAAWKSLRGEEVRLRMGGAAVPAQLVTCRPEDCAVGAAHWVCFDLDDKARGRLADFRHPAHFEIVNPAYKHESSALADDVRQSLLEDLEMSDRD
jgi:Protein of unknown function (DUF3501)